MPQTAFDLTAFFEKWGAMICLELANNVRNQVDLQGRAYTPTFRQTAGWRKKVKKGTAASTQGSPYPRMKNTGKFLGNAFKFDATATSLTIKVNPGGYDGITFELLIEYNDRDSTLIIGKRANVKQRFPALFPGVGSRSGITDIKQLKSYNQMIEEFKKEIYRQLKAMAIRGIKGLK